jgi:hypothetical protein
MANNNKEVWLRGPLDHFTPIVQPVAHALMQAKEEINKLLPASQTNIYGSVLQD